MTPDEGSLFTVGSERTESHPRCWWGAKGNFLVQGSEKTVEFHFIDTKKKKTTFYRQGFRALKMLRIIELKSWRRVEPNGSATTGSM